MCIMGVRNGNQESLNIYVPIKQAQFFATKASKFYFFIFSGRDLSTNTNKSLYLSGDTKLRTVRLI